METMELVKTMEQESPLQKEIDVFYNKMWDYEDKLEILINKFNKTESDYKSIPYYNTEILKLKSKILLLEDEDFITKESLEAEKNRINQVLTEIDLYVKDITEVENNELDEEGLQEYSDTLDYQDELKATKEAIYLKLRYI